MKVGVCPVCDWAVGVDDGTGIVLEHSPPYVPVIPLGTSLNGDDRPIFYCEGSGRVSLVSIEETRPLCEGGIRGDRESGGWKYGR
jgi:hypothetical protein